MRIPAGLVLQVPRNHEHRVQEQQPDGAYQANRHERYRHRGWSPPLHGQRFGQTCQDGLVWCGRGVYNPSQADMCEEGSTRVMCWNVLDHVWDNSGTWLERVWIKHGPSLDHVWNMFGSIVAKFGRALPHKRRVLTDIQERPAKAAGGKRATSKGSNGPPATEDEGASASEAGNVNPPLA